MKQYISIAIIVAIVAGALGYGIGFKIGRQKADADLSAATEKAKKYFPQITDMRSVNGTIKEVGEGRIVMETTGIENPFEELPKVRTVIAGGNTKVVLQEQKDPAQFQRELAEFQKKIPALKPGEVPADIGRSPTTYTEREISLSEVKVGWNITATSDKNIKMAEEFEATHIAVMSVPAQPPSAPAPATLP